MPIPLIYIAGAAALAAAGALAYALSDDGPSDSDRLREKERELELEREQAEAEARKELLHRRIESELDNLSARFALTEQHQLRQWLHNCFDESGPELQQSVIEDVLESSEIYAGLIRREEALLAEITLLQAARSALEGSHDPQW